MVQTKNKTQLSILALAFFTAGMGFHLAEVTLQQGAWFYWAASFVFLPVGLALNAGEYIYTRKHRPLEISISDSSFKFIFLTVASFVGYGLFHFVTGLFLSILLPMEPVHDFMINGYNKNFRPELLTSALMLGLPLAPSFILLKLSLLAVPQAIRLRGHSLLRDGVLPLIAGAIALIVLKKIGTSESLFIFCVLLFLPWTIILGNDRYAKKDLRQPELAVPVQIPVSHVYRPQVSPFWGILLLILASLILMLSTFGAFHIYQLNPGYAFLALIPLLIGLLVASGFVFGGINLLFSFRKIELTTSLISIYEKAYWVVLPKTKSWSAHFSDYLEVESEEKIIPGGRGASASVYVVHLKHKSDKKKDVELYRAYHSQDYESVARAWKKLLNYS